MAICAIVRNTQHAILIVEPTYRQDWLLPGGVIEVDESPVEACEREILEELGITLHISDMLCIEYQSQHSNKTESLQFIANGGIIDDQPISAITIREQELQSYEFASERVAQEKLNRLLWERMQFAFQGLREHRTIYIENKAPIEQ